MSKSRIFRICKVISCNPFFSFIYHTLFGFVWFFVSGLNTINKFSALRHTYLFTEALLLEYLDCVLKLNCVLNGIEWKQFYCQSWNLNLNCLIYLINTIVVSKTVTKNLVEIIAFKFPADGLSLQPSLSHLVQLASLSLHKVWLLVLSL